MRPTASRCLVWIHEVRLVQMPDTVVFHEWLWILLGGWIGIFPGHILPESPMRAETIRRTIDVGLPHITSMVFEPHIRRFPKDVLSLGNVMCTSQLGSQRIV
jgi:hypothetical protein